MIRKTVIVFVAFLFAGVVFSGCSMMGTQYNYGFIDKTGSFVITAQYGGAQSFSEGLAGVMVGSSQYGKWGLSIQRGIWLLRRNMTG